jgi:hypothetical protein
MRYGTHYFGDGCEPAHDLPELPPKWSAPLIGHPENDQAISEAVARLSVAEAKSLAQQATADAEVGRLDRILAEAAQWPASLLGSGAYIAAAPTPEVERLRGMAAALEAECAALAEAIDKVTHEWISQHPHSVCCAECGAPAHYPVHRTYARVRAELGHGTQ